MIDRIDARTSIHGLVTKAGVHQVVVVTAIVSATIPVRRDCVVAILAEQRVDAASAEQGIVAGSAVNFIVVAVAGQRVIAALAVEIGNRIRSRRIAAGDRVTELRADNALDIRNGGWTTKVEVHVPCAGRGIDRHKT